MAAKRGQHDVEAEEEALQAGGALSPVGAVEAMGGCCDPGVDGSVRGACNQKELCFTACVQYRGFSCTPLLSRCRWRFTRCLGDGSPPTRPQTRLVPMRPGRHAPVGYNLLQTACNMSFDRTIVESTETTIYEGKETFLLVFCHNSMLVYCHRWKIMPSE